MKVTCSNCGHKANISEDAQDKKCGFSLGWDCSKCRFLNSLVYKNGKLVKQNPVMVFKSVEFETIKIDPNQVPENFYNDGMELG